MSSMRYEAPEEYTKELSNDKTCKKLKELAERSSGNLDNSEEYSINLNKMNREVNDTRTPKPKPEVKYKVD